eukprot:CAMPEP_0118945086 /NCGR_PEP_ID=MMETSP1169-20130426/41599_1 /TAXON_ID=36882 /ORGANISM="Pyramimonas obovata, Strain CCMP722" /LENGTH=97 /DNA_ID=CAMNT_0006890725 /DNA_START=155 /DNA_END=444 /DNA_ORIENTATION=-
MGDHERHLDVRPSLVAWLKEWRREPPGRSDKSSPSVVHHSRSQIEDLGAQAVAQVVAQNEGVRPADALAQVVRVHPPDLRLVHRRRLGAEVALLVPR